MPAKLTLPVYIRIGNRGTEHLVGYTSWDLDSGEVTNDLARLETEFPKMLDESPELEAFGIVREGRDP
ncbi:hypothetical protein QFW82_23655 [Streptomyces malaysiensis subsp. malaysiensis]|uniref:hypothetical protein n=1 Tax=Streptomyces malaysiensis TaxID=92644 RepID=UPI0024BFD3AB|nr:hypothetical protein [Streptomyces sp. NA07423]WHX19828.1 hypothetical protein QFW82_23655 [Streptomyces sp. NA07423]